MQFVELLRVISQKPGFYFPYGPSIGHLQSFICGYKGGRRCGDEPTVLDAFQWSPCSHPRPRPGVAELGVVRRRSRSLRTKNNEHSPPTLALAANADSFGHVVLLRWCFF